ALMTVAILTVHLRNGIWNSAGGFEFPLLIMASAYLVSALGSGSLSINHWARSDNWGHIPWAAQDSARAGAAPGVGVAARLSALAAGAVGKAIRGETPHPLDHPLHT